MSVKCQSSGELNWVQGFQGPLLQVGTDSPKGPLPALGGYMFYVTKGSEIGEAEKCPHPKEPLSGTLTTQIGGREMLVQCVTYTAPVFV